MNTNKGIEEFETGEFCPSCGKPIIGGKVAFGNIIIKRKCECVILQEEAERRRNIEKGTGIIRQYMIRKSGLRSHWLNKTFENFEPRAGQETAHKTAKNFADGFYTGEGAHSGGVMLCGATGCGKTHLAAAIANSIIQQTKISEKDAENAGASGYYSGRAICPVRFSSTVELLAQLKAEYASENDNSGCIMAAYKKSPLIILDDFGAERQTEWATERLFEIIDWRYSDELPIIITTNATPDEIKNKMGARIYDRLREMCKFEAISAKSQRVTAK